MKKLVRLSIAVTLTIGLLAACTSKEDKVCDHLVNEIKVDGGKYTVDACKKDVAKLATECENPDAVIDCTLGSESEEEAGQCWEKCKKKDKEQAANR